MRGRLGLALLCVVMTIGMGTTEAKAAPANTGQPGSSCAAAVDKDGRYTPPEPGVTTTGLGEDAPAYYEIGPPIGTHVGSPKAIMLVIHPGGWFIVGKEVMAHWARPIAEEWRNAGWETVNIDYRACGQSVSDVLWFMQRVRALHPNAVICATGSSAGGHLALMLATMRTDLACAISLAGPSDLLTLAHQGGATVANYAAAAFGASPSALAQRSPRLLASQIQARVLLATGQTDPLVPAAQDAAFAATFRAARPGAYVDTYALPPGDQFFVHTYVTKQSLDILRMREQALVAPLVARSHLTLDG